MKSNGLIALALFGSAAMSADLPRSIDPLIARDSISDRSITVLARVERDAIVFDPTQGRSVYSIEYVRNGGNEAVQVIELEFPAVGYRPPGAPGHQPVDYGRDSELLLWRRLAASGVRSEDRNVRYEVSRLADVFPDGSVTNAAPHYQLTIYSQDSVDSVAAGRQLLMALGVGLTAGKGEPLQIKEAEAGVEITYADDNYPLAMWLIRVDPQLPEIVRYAAFVPPERSAPTIVIQTEGHLEIDGRHWPTRGRLMYIDAPELALDVRLDHAVLTADLRLLEAIVEDTKGELPIGASEIIDRRDGEFRRMFLDR